MPVALEDLPPRFAYVLDRDNATCRTRTGCAAIAWRRETDPKVWSFDIAWCSAQRAWRDWLCAWGGAATSAACGDPVESRRYAWRGAGRLRDDVRAAQRDSQRAFARMVAELAKLGELTAEEAARAEHCFVVVLHDERVNRNKPLPKPADLLLPRPRGN